MNVFPSRLELLSPRGGEHLLAGSLHEVRWRVHGYAGETVRIEYNLDGFTTSYPFLATGEAAIDDSFTWRLPEEPSDVCRLRVVSNELGLSAESPRTFAISGPGITCLYPNGGDVFETGSVHTVRWRSLGNPALTVRLPLSLDDSQESFPFLIADDVPDTGSYLWEVPSHWTSPEILSERCRLRVRSTSGASWIDSSDGNFAIRQRGALRTLVWIPFTDFDREEVRGAIAAMTLVEHDLDWVLSKAVSEAELTRDLTGRDNFIMVEQDPTTQVNFAGRGRLLGPVLERFAQYGGTVVILKQRGNAGGFLPATGLLEATEIGRGLDIPARVVLPDHPVTAGVPAEFRSGTSTGWYAVGDERADVYATTETGEPIAVGRDLDDADGRTVALPRRFVVPSGDYWRQRRMRKRKLGNSGLELSTVGLGTWAIGGTGWAFSWGAQDDEDSVAAIHRAVDLGVNWIDTAAVYGAGHAEEIVGRAVKGLGESRRPLVATKFGRICQPDGSIRGVLTPASVRAECEASLRRLGVEAIDLYQMHWPDPPEQIEAAWETLVELKGEGKVRSIGVSNFEVAQMERLRAIHPIASLQPPYNMIVRTIEDGVLEYCARHGIGVIAYSPMCKGLLSGAFSLERVAELEDEDHRSRDPKFASPQLEVHLELVEGLKRIAGQKDRPVRELAIAWVLRRPEVTAAIVGARRAEQIEGTAAASEWDLSDAEIRAIDALLEKHRKALDALGAVDTGRV